MVVEQATFRLATVEEAQAARGGIIWRATTFPWKVMNVALGTFNLYLNKENVLAWRPPLPLRVFSWLTSGLWPEQRFTTSFPSIIFNLYRFTDHKVAEALLAPHRNDQIFAATASYHTLLEVVKRTFPETLFTSDDLIVSCSPAYSGVYRSLFTELLNSETAVNAVREEMERALKGWLTQDYVNVTEETRVISSNIITRVLFGKAAGSYELTHAVNFINLYLVKKLVKKVTAEDEKEFWRALQLFNAKTNEVINSREPIPFFQGHELTLAQKQAQIFATFFAGQETVSALMNYMLYELAKNPEKQKELATREVDSQLLQQVFINAIHDFTPAGGVGRKAKEDLCLEYRFQGEEQSRKAFFFKGDQLGADIVSLASQTPLPQTTHAGWLPFGGGTHKCPGMMLAEKEVKTLAAEIIQFLKQGGKMELSPTTGAVYKKALFTLQLSEDIRIKFQTCEK